MKSTSLFLIFLIICLNENIGNGAVTTSCDSTAKDQCKLIVTYAQQNSFNETDLCWSLTSAVNCLKTLAPSCKSDFDWNSTITDYTSQIKRLNCYSEPPPVCDTVKMIDCLNLAIDAEGELKAEQQCLKFQNASACSMKLVRTCRFTPVWINVDLLVSDKVERCAEEYCNATSIAACVKDADSGTSRAEICSAAAKAVSCLQPLEPGCRNYSNWNNMFEQLNSVVDECGLVGGCFLDEVRKCMTNVLGVSLDGSTVPGSICQNYPSFKSCWDKHAPLCSANPVFHSLQGVASHYHECQTKCDTNKVIEVGNCYIGLRWASHIEGFSHVDQLRDICQNLTQFTNCYLPNRGACFYNDYIKFIVPDMDYVVNITKKLCQQEILEVDEDCFNNSKVENQMAKCNKEIFKPLPTCGTIKSPNFNCTEGAVSNLCGSDNSSVAVQINEELFKLFSFRHNNAPCTHSSTHVPTSSHITSASGSVSSRYPVSTPPYRTTSETNGGNSLKKNFPLFHNALYLLILTYLPHALTL